MKAPLVSYVIPVYNYGRYVAHALESFRQQDYPDLEAIVVDDCSTDDSVAIVERFMTLDARIRLIRAPHNRGVGASDAAGVAEAKGEFICFCDADDALMPQKTKMQVEVMQARPEVGVVATYVRQIDEHGAEVADGDQTLWSNQQLPLNDPETWLWRNHLVRSSTMVRRRVFDVIGPPSAAHRAGQDNDLWLRALAGGFHFSVVPQVLTDYRFHTEGISRRGNVEKARYWGYAVSCYRALHPFLLRAGRQDLLRANLATFAASPEFAPQIWDVLALPAATPPERGFEVATGPPSRGVELLSPWAQQRIAELATQVNQLEEELTHRAATEAILRQQTRELSQRVDAGVARLAELTATLEHTQHRLWSTLQSRTYRTGQLLGTPVRVGRQLVERVPGLSRLVHHVRDRKASRVKRVLAQERAAAPLVSVVIPCFNYGNYVGEAVASALAQTFQDLEIIVVDGGSTDGTTPAVVQALAQPRVQVLLRSEPHQAGDNRNFGIARANGKYIVCLDADDLLAPTYVEKAVFLAEAGGFDVVHPAVRTFGAMQMVWENGDASFPEIAEGNQVSTCALFRRSLWQAHGGYVDFGRGHEHVPEDWEFWTRLLGHGARAKVLPELLFHYRTHQQSLTAHSRMPLDEQRRRIRQANLSLFSDTNVEEVRAAQLHELVVDQPLLNLDRHHLSGRYAFFAMPAPDQPGAFALALLAAERLAQEGWRIAFLCDQTTVRRDAAASAALARMERVSADVFDFAMTPTESMRRNLARYLLRSRSPALFVADGAEALRHRMQSSDAMTTHTRVLTRLSDLQFKARPRATKTRILLCVPWLDRGGSSSLLRSIFSCLGHALEVHVVATTPEPCTHGEDPSLYDYALSATTLDLDMPAAQKRDAVVLLCEMLGIDTVLVVGSRAAYDALEEIKRRLPHVRVCDQLYNPHGHVTANAAVSQLVDHNIAASEEVVTALLAHGVDPKRITLVEHGVDPSVFSPRRRTARSAKFPTVGFLGRLSEEKRPLDVIEAAARLPELQFRIAGMGPMAEEARQRKDMLRATNCHILGHVESALSFYDSVDVLLLTSRTEGTPITMLEAMALGKIIVATRVGNIPNVITHGKDGLLYESGNLDALVGCLRQVAGLSEVQRESMQRKARERIERHHDIADIAQQYLQLLGGRTTQEGRTVSEHSRA